MALFTFANALTAIREVIDDAGGSIRTIAATRFTDDLDPSVTEDERQRRGIRSDKPFRVRFTDMKRNAASPPMNGSVLLYDLGVEVTVSRTVSPLEQISSDDFATLEALGWEDAEALRQALCTPPNLATTAAAAATNIVGDALIYIDSRGRVVPIQGDGAQRYETVHRFTAIIQSSPATA